MKPLNLDNSPCTPVSSNCVIWAGPNIPCIKLCTGDTVSDVVYKLATELCTIIDYLNVDSYDLSCFNLASCTPNNFQELLQFLIDRICALENIDPTTVVTTTTTTSPSNRSTAVTDYLMTAAPCFGGGTVTLVDYVDQIANRICSIATDISIINSGINSLDIRVTALESAPAPSFVIPSFILQCSIGTIIPVLAAGSTQDIDVVLSRFINEEWCPYKAVFDTSTNLSNAITSQCILGTDDAEALKYSAPGTQMQVAYPAYVAAPTTLAEAVNNLWIALCDVRNAGDELVTVTAGNNVTVTATTTVVGPDEVIDYTIDAKDTVVAAGDNVTITSVTSPTDVTTYTINAKESIVVGADDIVVTPVTVGNDTTYTISRPKQSFFDQVVGWADVNLDAVPASYHFPLGYSGLTYTNTTGVTKTFTVHVNFDTNLVVGLPTNNNINLINWLDAAIVKTVLGVDTVQYESFAGRLDISGSLFDGALPTDIVNTITAETVVTTPSSNAVEFRFLNGELGRNVSFFTLITLNNNESVSLKFKAKDALTPALLARAQILVQEL
jgi:hypothetical protein